MTALDGLVSDEKTALAGEHQRESQRGDLFPAIDGNVGDDDALFRGGLDVHVVEALTEPRDDLAVLQPLDGGAVELAAYGDDGVGIRRHRQDLFRGECAVLRDLTAEAVDDVLLHVRDGHNVIDKNDLELAHACTSASISLNTFSP